MTDVTLERFDDAPSTSLTGRWWVGGGDSRS